MTLEELILSYETDFFRAQFCQNRPALASRFCDDFVEHAKSGRIYSKAEEIESLGSLRQNRDISILDFTLTLLDDNVCLARYRSFDATENAHALRMSVWVQRDGRWQLLFHQGTPQASSQLTIPNSTTEDSRRNRQ